MNDPTQQVSPQHVMHAVRGSGYASLIEEVADEDLEELSQMLHDAAIFLEGHRERAVHAYELVQERLCSPTRLASVPAPIADAT